MNVIKYIFLMAFGGIVYYGIEILYRGYSHWSMILVGGLCFIVCGLMNEIFDWNMSIWLQMLYCSLLVTVIEFVSGCILNLWLNYNVWDYSNMPLNILGQVCLPFMIIWYALSLLAIVLDDYLRYLVFSERKPSYNWR